MMYSVGKAFHPARPPIPLLQVDTGWKFREMIQFRDPRAADMGMELRTWMNPDGIARGIGPISHGATVSTAVMKT